MALTGLDIYKLLPKTNCKDCGFATCLAFAMALAQKKVLLDKCPHVTLEAKASLESASQPPIKLVTIGTGDKKIEIGLVYDEGITLRADERQLKQLFLNLLDNAVKYTPAGGKVAMAVRREKAGARIRIQDTGRGIAKDQIERIFDRFYRVDESRTERGFGLGLSIAKSIAEAHGGSISVLSRPGDGTTFKITLPLAKI